MSKRWSFGATDSLTVGIFEGNPLGQKIADVCDFNGSRDKAFEHAKRITTAVNCHDELLEALQGALQVLNACSVGHASQKYIESVISKATEG